MNYIPQSYNQHPLSGNIGAWNKVPHQQKTACMKKQRLLLLALMLSLASALSAQTHTITGTITDAKTGEKMQSVSIIADHQKHGTVTNADGTYTVNVSPNSQTLNYSFVGYTARAVPINGRTTIDITLEPQGGTLNDVVLIGYGTQRKKDLTGSIVSISAKDADQAPITRPDQMIQGRASGVQVIQTNSAPGGNISIRIRGTNSINSSNEPLFVVDGFPGAGDLNTINPSDIESIEILKDASATAIYGSRGANGVVLITTQKGKPGAQSINFENYYGTQTAQHLYKMMNAPQFA